MRLPAPRPPESEIPPSSQPSPQAGPRRPDSRPHRVEVGRASRSSGKDFERSGLFFSSVLPRSQRKELGQINGKLILSGLGYSAPAPPGLRAGTQPPPRGVRTPGTRRALPAPQRSPSGGAAPRPPGGSRIRSGLEPLPWEKVSERVRIQMRRLSMLSASRAPARGWARSWRGSERSGLGRRSPGRPRPLPPLHTRAHTHTLARTNSLPFPLLSLSLFPSSPVPRSPSPSPFTPSLSPPPLPFIIPRLKLHLSRSLSSLLSLSLPFSSSRPLLPPSA